MEPLPAVLFFGLTIGVILMFISLGEGVRRLAFNCAPVSILCIVVARVILTGLGAIIGVNRATSWLAGAVYVSIAIALPLRYMIFFAKDFAESDLKWKGREVRLAITVWIVVTMAIHLSFVAAGFGFLPIAFR